MSLFEKAGSVLVLFLFITSMISVSAGSVAYQKVEGKCDALNQSSINVTIFPGEIKLNGSSVDSVECENLEAYDYPRDRANSNDLLSSLTTFLMAVFFPVSVYAIGIAIGRAYSIKWSELGKILGSSIGLTLIIVVMNYVKSTSRAFDNSIGLSSILLLTGPLIPSLLFYFRGNSGDKGHKWLKALLAFVFSITVYSVFFSFLALRTKSL